MSVAGTARLQTRDCIAWAGVCFTGTYIRTVNPLLSLSRSLSLSLSHTHTHTHTHIHTHTHTHTPTPTHLHTHTPHTLSHFSSFSLSFGPSIYLALSLPSPLFRLSLCASKLYGGLLVQLARFRGVVALVDDDYFTRFVPFGRFQRTLACDVNSQLAGA